MKNQNLNFGAALEAAKEGKLIAREGWNGKGMFVFMRPEDSLTKEFCVGSMKSLPTAVKIYLDQQCQNNTEKGYANALQETVKFTAYLCMKAADGSIVNGWLASQTDMLANDWQILEV